MINREIRMINICHWDDTNAMRVFSDLDPNDQLEAALWRGDGAAPLAVFADWRVAGGGGSMIARYGVIPFAVMALTPLGPKGVASAALLARDHRCWRRALVALVRVFQDELPRHFASLGLTRVECRSWAGHPTAARLIEAVGFRREADLRGFGGGALTFTQFAWTAPTEET